MFWLLQRHRFSKREHARLGTLFFFVVFFTAFVAVLVVFLAAFVVFLAAFFFAIFFAMDARQPSVQRWKDFTETVANTQVSGPLVNLNNR